MSLPTDTLFYRLLTKPIAYPAVNNIEADALWNALLGILGFHSRIPRTQEESFIQVYDVNTAGTTRTLKREVADDGSGTSIIIQDDPIGTLNFIEFQINTQLEQTTPNRGRMTAIWNRLVTDSVFFVPLPGTFGDSDTTIAIHSCNHDFDPFAECVKFKEIINNTVTIDEAFP